MVDQDGINKFLGYFKKCVTEKGLLLIQRQKNIETITKLGLTLLDIRKEILKLDYKDYISGPKEDRDFPGEVWEFGKLIEYEDVYIKLKLKTGDKPVCLSFHRFEREAKYPFKKKGQFK
jgi:hypothetical protein